MYEPHSEGSFNLRYWFDATYYKDGGPVIVLQSGLNSGVGRLAILQKGILHQLAKATHGIGVVLEHRYYGASWPVANLSTQSLRFLTTDQAMADQAYFAKNVVFAGLEEKNLTAPNTAYIAYGGSYAGAFVAFLRKLYPDVFWGMFTTVDMIDGSDRRQGPFLLAELRKPSGTTGPTSNPSVSTQTSSVLPTRRKLSTL